jgi:site-specific DNA recombinase
MAWDPGAADVGEATRAVIVAVYCRLSKLGGRGIDRQEKDCRRISAARGWVVGEVFQETASADPYSKKARKEWLRLLAAIERHEFGAVVVWLEDRSNRNLVEAAEFVNVCREAGVRLVIAGNDTEYDFSDPEDVAKFYGESARAQQELARMQKRIRRQKRELAEEGKDNGGGYRPFGYRSDRMTVDESEATLLKEAARRVLAGDSLRGICVEWNKKGLRTPTGREWQNQVLRRSLISPRVAGYREHDGILVPAMWPAILDSNTWEGVRVILMDPARVTMKGAPSRYLLTSLVWCGKCGDRMRGQRRVQKGREYVSYTCENRFGRGRCSERNVRDVDHEVTARLLYRLTSPQVQSAAKAVHDEADSVSGILAELARLQAQCDRVGDEAIDRLAEDVDEETKKQLLKAAQRKRERLEHEMDRLRQKHAQLTGNRVLTHLPPNIAEVWPDLSLDRQRAILAAVVERVEIHPQGKGWRFDPEKVKVIWKA